MKITSLVISLACMVAHLSAAHLPDADRFLTEYVAAYAAKDADRLFALYAEDVQFEDPTFNVVFNNRADLKKSFVEGMKDYTEIQFLPERHIAGADSLVVIGTGKFNYQGRPLEMRFNLTFFFRDGKIVREYDFFDSHEFYTKTGKFVRAATPPPAAVSTAGVAAQADGPTEARQLDFWLGDWEVFDNNRHFKIGENTITLVEKGRVLLEQWRDIRGGSGVSLSAWDAEKKRWQQTWMDADGLVITSYGRSHGGRFIWNEDVTTAGRGTLTPQADGTVRHQIEKTDDGGKTWRTTFDATYRRKPVK